MADGSGHEGYDCGACMKERISQVWARLEGREFLARLKTEDTHMPWLKILLGVSVIGAICVIGFIWVEIWRLENMR